MTSSTLLPSYSRYVLAGVGDICLACPDVFVVEILIVDRAELLPVPFFDSALLGLVHQQSEIIPLISLQRVLFGNKSDKILVPEKIIVVRLSEELEEIAGTGLVIDRVIGSVSAEEYATQSATQTRLEDIVPRFEKNLHEPFRWHPSLN